MKIVKANAPDHILDKTEEEDCQKEHSKSIRPA